MTALYDLALGTVAGAATCALHLWVLWRGLARLAPGAAPQAGRRLVRGLPWRLLLWAPACLLAARLGLFGCLGLLAGAAAVRWWTVIRALRSGPAARAQIQ